MKGIAIIVLFAAVAAAKPREHVEALVSCSDDPDTLQQHANCDQFYRCIAGNQVVQSCPALLLFNTEKNICDWRHNVLCNGRVLPEDRPEPEFDPSITSEICAQKDVGDLIAHEECHKFYVCNQIGQASVVRCPDNLFFNSEKAQCDWPENVQCGAVVPAAQTRLSYISTCIYTEGNETVPIAHENCNRFYKCETSGLVPFDCPSGLMFNTDTLYCDWHFNVECGTRTIADLEPTPEPEPWTPVHGYDDPSQAGAICAAEGSDSILIAHENCSQFYKCYLGRPLTIDCPKYLVYNPAHEYCDWPENVDCGNRKH